MSLRLAFLIIKRYAGHSKWQNIRHTKAEKDHQKSLLFVKLAQRIKVAIHENGNNTNPALNLHLAHAIEYAKSRDMPMSSIQSVIKSTQMNKDAAKPYQFTVRGPKGSLLLVTTLTSSMGKTKQDICVCLKKVGGIMTEFPLDNHFEKKGIIVAKPPPNIENVDETSVEHAIEAGAEEVSPLDDGKLYTFTCEIPELHKAKTKLEELNYKVEEVKTTYIPKISVNLNDDEMELMGNIIEKLEQLPEITDIHDNIA